MKLNERNQYLREAVDLSLVADELPEEPGTSWLLGRRWRTPRHSYLVQSTQGRLHPAHRTAAGQTGAASKDGAYCDLKDRIENEGDDRRGAEDTVDTAGDQRREKTVEDPGAGLPADGTLTCSWGFHVFRPRSTHRRTLSYTCRFNFLEMMVWARVRVTHWGGGLGAPRYTGTRLWYIQQSTSPGLSHNCARHARLRPKWSVRGIDRCAQGCVSSRRGGRRTSGESPICWYRYIKHHICCPHAFNQLVTLDTKLDPSGTVGRCNQHCSYSFIKG